MVTIELVSNYAQLVWFIVFIIESILTLKLYNDSKHVLAVLAAITAVLSFIASIQYLTW